jgi:hypothetical protein
MEINEIIILGIGTLVSVIAFYLKREALKIERVHNDLRKMEIDLAKNDARDAERWIQIQKLLEDRRIDAIKIFEKINNLK